MKSLLPATHIVRQFMLFVLIMLFLLIMIRSAHALWQFPELEESGAFVALFVQGVRFDLALIGIICIIPVVLGSLLSMTIITRGIAKFLIAFFLIGGLFLTLVLELITPWFIASQAARPDVPMMSAVESPLNVLRSVVMEYTWQVALGAVLSILILIAYKARMELPRFLRYRLSVPGAFVTAVLGGALCILAIWSPIDSRKLPLGPGDALISANNTVNELSMNSAYKTLYSVLLPYFNEEVLNEEEPSE